MNVESIRKFQSRNFDWHERGAAMVLAWKMLANEHGAQRNFSKVTREEFGRHLSTAAKMVTNERKRAKREEIAKTNPRIIQLRMERDLLANKSFAISISAEQSMIDAEIRSIINSIEV